MILACVGIYAQNFTSKIAPSHDLITLRSITGTLSSEFSAFFTGAELLDTFIPHKLVKSVAESTVGIRVQTELLTAAVRLSQRQ
jgi:hypothetical protein